MSNIISKKTLMIGSLLLFCGFGGYTYFLRNVAVSKDKNPEPTPIEQPANLPEIKSSASDAQGVVTLEVKKPDQTESFFKTYTIRFPKDWEFEDVRMEDIRFSISKGEYIINVAQPSIGGGACLFKDTDLKDVPEPFLENPVLESFVEFAFSQGTFRRYTIEGEEGQTDQLFAICEKIKTRGPIFQIPTNAGAIWYKVPLNADPAMLKEMDTILSSITYLE